VVGCASDAASKSEVRTLQASVKQLQDENMKLLERIQALETERAVARAAQQPLGPLLAAAPPTPTGSEVPTLAVVKLKPRADRAPPLDVRTSVQEPDAELVAALARPAAPVADARCHPARREFAQAQEALRTGNLGGGVERMTRFAEAHRRIRAPTTRSTAAWRAGAGRAAGPRSCSRPRSSAIRPETWCSRRCSSSPSAGCGSQPAEARASRAPGDLPSGDARGYRGPGALARIPRTP
jgi:hypothetical protein